MHQLEDVIATRRPPYLDVLIRIPYTADNKLVVEEIITSEFKRKMGARAGCAHIIEISVSKVNDTLEATAKGNSSWVGWFEFLVNKAFPKETKPKYAASVKVPTNEW